MTLVGLLWSVGIIVAVIIGAGVVVYRKLSQTHRAVLRVERGLSAAVDVFGRINPHD